MSAFTDYLSHRRQLAEARMRYRSVMFAADTERMASYNLFVSARDLLPLPDNFSIKERLCNLASKHATSAAEILREAKEENKAEEEALQAAHNLRCSLQAFVSPYPKDDEPDYHRWARAAINATRWVTDRVDAKGDRP